MKKRKIKSGGKIYLEDNIKDELSKKEIQKHF